VPVAGAPVATSCGHQTWVL